MRLPFLENPLKIVIICDVSDTVGLFNGFKLLSTLNVGAVIDDKLQLSILEF